MIALALLRRLFAHAAWADARILGVFERASPPPPPGALQEFAHLLAGDELWLARLEGRPARLPLWPVVALADLAPLARALEDAYARYLDTLTEADLARPVRYAETGGGGATLETSVADVLAHVAMHAHYHRGKVTLMLRQAELVPVPTDYSAYLRETSAPADASTPAPTAALREGEIRVRPSAG